MNRLRFNKMQPSI